MKKKDLITLLEKVMPLEIANSNSNEMTKPMFKNLKLA